MFVRVTEQLLAALQDSLPEWSKGVDSSSTSASCVSSNPTAVSLSFLYAGALVPRSCKCPQCCGAMQRAQQFCLAHGTRRSYMWVVHLQWQGCCSSPCSPRSVCGCDLATLTATDCRCSTHDPVRTQTCNLRFRRPTPYPLGHRATCDFPRVSCQEQYRTTIISPACKGRHTTKCNPQ